MGYSINLEDISLDKYCDLLKSAKLVPSRMLLRDNVDEKFEHIKLLGLTNVLELQKALKTKVRLNAFAAVSRIKVEYLKVLIREINSNCPHPIKLSFFDEVSAIDIAKLHSHGIVNTKQLFNYILSHESRCALSEIINVPYSVVLTLSHYTDLVRIRWVNHTFAKALYFLGVDSVFKVANTDYTILYQNIIEMNKQEKIYKGNIGENDIKLCIEAAKLVPQNVIF